MKKPQQDMSVAKKSGEENPYIPNRGDIVWLEFDPSQGREIKKKRPALVISPMEYNQKVGLALMCPITSHIKGYPFEVPLPPSGIIQGAILADHIKSLDWKARNVKFAESTSLEVVNKVTEILLLLIEVF